MSKFPDFPYLPPGFELEDELRDQLSNRPGNPRCVVGRDELLLVVHEVPKNGGAERVPLFFWRRMDETWLDSAGGKGLRKLGELLERHEQFIREQEKRIGNARGGREVFEVLWVAVALAKCSRELAAAIDQALNHDEDSRDLKSFRDRVREIERAAELHHQGARLTMEFWKEKHGGDRDPAGWLPRLLLFILPLAVLRLVFGMDGGGWWIPAAGLAAGAALVWIVHRNIGKGP